MSPSVWLKLTVVVLVLAVLTDSADVIPPEYRFKRYAYRKKSRSEKKIKSLKTQCESFSECQSLYGLDQIRCARRCMSVECYDELYAHDELEEGEIDVSFPLLQGLCS